MENSTTFTKDWRVKIGTLVMVLAIVIASVAVRPARADKQEQHNRQWRAQEQRHYAHGHSHHRGVTYAPAPYVYYAPPPVVYVPPPPPGGFTFIFPFTIR
jgi:hypothetical protein